MPTATFFRLPEEKRTRLIEACWGELTRVRFTDVSINRIIAAARIPRGSFYQYFEDKEDPIRYLLEDMRQYFITQLRDILVEAKGDLFALPLMAYDRFIGRQGHTDPMLTLFIQLITLNKGLDLQSLIGSPQGFIGEQQYFLPDPLWEVVDPSRLRRNEREYADQVFHLACAVLAFAIVETLHCRIPSDRVRELIRLRMDLLRCGGASDSYKEENT
ncbi:MAG: TetR/AcrR family transcriptional regulator [Lawsonibacter sp.]|nr:TetR/AcrR family transcriptional regulator [Lawsonibacter sp.]